MQLRLDVLNRDDELVERARRRTGSMGERQPRSLTQAERRALLAEPSRRYPTGVRNRAMMANAGLRCAELLALRPRDVDLDSYLLRSRSHARPTSGSSAPRLAPRDGRRCFSANR
jgi:integrase